MKRCKGMDGQGVHHQSDFPAGEEVVYQFADQMRPVVPGLAVGHIHSSPAEQRSEHHERVGDTVAFVFEVDDGGLTGPDGCGVRVFFVCCFEVSSMHTSTLSSSSSRCHASSASSVAKTNSAPSRTRYRFLPLLSMACDRLLVWPCRPLIEPDSPTEAGYRASLRSPDQRSCPIPVGNGSETGSPNRRQYRLLPGTRCRLPLPCGLACKARFWGSVRIRRPVQGMGRAKKPEKTPEPTSAERYLQTSGLPTMILTCGHGCNGVCNRRVRVPAGHSEPQGKTSPGFASH